MIRPVNHHPQANVLILADAIARHQRFHGTEADSEHPMRHPKLTEQDLDVANDWPTTRRFPRSLHSVDSAFPNDVAYADPFERFQESVVEQDAMVSDLSWKWANRCIALIGICLLVAWGFGVLLALRG
jgi:hypothetical protein